MSQSGHTYTLDVELEGLEAKRIYFPKGGWVDLEGCELEDDYGRLHGRERAALDV